ncbi:hypothetical protein Q6332_30560, partial [Klebsiella pneumoniae]|uniref:hypothetical protein n=1 Tax=Klebsiella pneumoniae TaxID=573 RepID=UPI0027317F9A
MSALLLGAALLFTFYQVHKAVPEQTRHWERVGAPWLAALGLGCAYLLAPLLLSTQGCVISWAVAGVATLWAG